MQRHSFSSSQSDPNTEPFVVGVDVGGTKIAAGVVNARGQVAGRIMLPTDTRNSEATLQSIATSVTRAIEAAGLSKAQISAVGLGIPGKVDPERGIGLLAVNLGWRNVPVRDWLEKALGLPCTIENDVSSATLGESLYGAGQGIENLVYLSLGTGIAARVMLGGQLYRGSHGLAGELGHAIFVPDGPLCLCGARGCLEALAAGPALVRRAQEELRTGRASLLQEVQSPELTAKEVFEAAELGDELALQVLHEAAAHIAYAIYLLTLTFDPQLVVLGGGLAQAEGPFIEAIRAGLARWSTQSPLFREILDLQDLRVSILGRDVGILGAAAQLQYRQNTLKHNI